MSDSVSKRDSVDEQPYLMPHQPANNQNPQLVYHYTSLDALISIVESRSLWCTAISYLNDAGEIDYLFRAVSRRLQELQAEGETNVQGIQVNRWPQLAPEDRFDLSAEPFVTSFTEQSDSLMHWRSYCPQQSGVALGFRTECLKRAYINDYASGKEAGKRIGFGKVRYINPDNNAEVDQEIRRIVDGIDRITKSPATAEWLFSGMLMGRASASKHNSFEVEREYRLRASLSPDDEFDLKFRTVRSTLVPYVSVHIPNREVELAEPKKESLVPPWGDYSPPAKASRRGKERAWDALEEVVVGPSANMKLTLRALKAFFTVKYMKTQLRASGIAHRDW